MVGLGNVDNTSDASKSVNYAGSAGAAPASDVYAWAKSSVKPSYSKTEVGLGNVDNTADAAKSVNYASSAGTAASNMLKDMGVQAIGMTMVAQINTSQVASGATTPGSNI
jgi:hypothetical protein